MCVSAYLWKRRCNVCAKVSIRNSKQRSRTAILKDLGFKSDMRRRTMKKRIKVEVKAKHIKQGTPRSGSSCPKDRSPVVPMSVDVHIESRYYPDNRLKSNANVAALEDHHWASKQKRVSH